MSTGTTVKLQYPVTVNGGLVTELFMRRPKVRDLRAAHKQLGQVDADDAAVEVLLIANLCEQTPETIEELDLADWSALQEAYRDFLPNTPSTDNSFG